MGFFDGLEQKMKNASEASNLNGKIRENEKLLDKHYYDLGKLYFEKHGTSPSEETDGICKAIASCLDEIAQLKKKLVIVKGLKLCPSCGAECPSDVAFCSVCGTKLPAAEMNKQEEQTIRFCAGCGTKLSADAAFCPSCGTPAAPAAVEEPAVEEPAVEEPAVEEPAVVEPAVEEPAVVEPAVEEPAVEEPAVVETVPEGMKKCAACGAYVVEKALFCGNCGMKF